MIRLIGEIDQMLEQKELPFETTMKPRIHEVKQNRRGSETEQQGMKEWQRQGEPSMSFHAPPQTASMPMG
jgi:hypothetical protein